MKKLIIIGGPTASGKTALAIAIAQRFGIDIISADSRQFFRELEIGTAKPTPEELAQATHHLVNTLSIEDHYSVGDFERDVLALLDELFVEKDAAILVGGSGLYIKAICEGLDNFPTIPSEISEALQADYERYGLAFLQQELQAKDPEYFAEADTENPRRLLRALSIIRTTKQSFSSFRKGQEVTRNFEPIYLCLLPERELLYARINQRVDEMVANGLVEEARQFYDKRHLNSLRTVGYQEFMYFFDNKISKEEAIELVKRNTRRYAKRQSTWFRNQQPKNNKWHYFQPENRAAIFDFLDKFSPKISKR